MSYTQTPLPLDVQRLSKPLADHLTREFRDIEEAQRHDNFRVKYEVIATAPERPEIGAMYYANGTTWNPGSGEGLYVYTSDGQFSPVAGKESKGWQSFSPSLSAGSGSFTTATASMRYKLSGGILFFRAAVDITTAGTAASFALITMPKPAINTAIVAYGRESRVTGNQLQGIGITFNDLAILKYDNTTAIGNNHLLQVNGFYEYAT